MITQPAQHPTSPLRISAPVLLCLVSALVRLILPLRTHGALPALWRLFFGRAASWLLRVKRGEQLSSIAALAVSREIKRVHGLRICRKGFAAGARRTRGYLLFLVLLPGAVAGAKVISAIPGTQVFGSGTWYFYNCDQSAGLGSYTINIQPMHGTATVGVGSAPVTGCPQGSPSLPFAVSYYTMNVTTPPASSDYYQLLFSLNGQTYPPIDIYILNGNIVAKQNGRPCDCSGSAGVGGMGNDAGGPASPPDGGSGWFSNGRSAQASYISAATNLGSGNVFYSIVDYSTAGQNPLYFTRYYNSLGNLATQLALPEAGVVLSSSLAIEAGGNWRSNYDRYLKITSAKTIIAERPDGQQIDFTLNGSTWTPDTDIDVTLAQNGSQWTLTDTDDTEETYSTATLPAGAAPTSLYAQLNSIRSRNGYTQTLTYSGGALSAVTDSYNRSLSFTYSNGLLQSVTTPDNLVITYGYTALSPPHVGNQLTNVTYPTTPQASQTYVYGNGSLPFALTGIVDENGNTYESWAYDGYGRGVNSQLGSGANATSITYSGDTSRIATNALGVQDTYTFTVLQNIPKVTQISRAATSTTAAATSGFSYDANGYVASRTDWNGNKTTYVNNSHGSPITINEAVGSSPSVTRTTTIAYDPTWVHLPDTVSTPGVTISYTYDGNGNVLTRKLTDTTTTSAPYSTNGQTRTWTNTWSNHLLASVKSPNGNTTAFGYGSSGALTSVKDALNHTTNITSYTGGGLPKVIVDPNSTTTTLAYDARQRLTSKAISASGATTLTTTYTVDPTGEITKINPPSGAYISYAYDTAHRVIKETNALGDYKSFSLDALGDITQESIYNKSGDLNQQHSGVFDALGRLTEDEGAISGEDTYYTHDKNGNVLTVKDPLSHTTTNVYDALNRLHTSTDANGGVTTIAYDAHDRPLTVTDANGHATTYVYDGFGDQIEQVSPDSGTLVSHYDSDANRSSTTDALGVLTNYTYDALDRIVSRNTPSDNSQYMGYLYDTSGGTGGAGIGRLTTTTYLAGFATLHYNPLGILDETINYNTAGTQLNGVYYSIDSAGRVAGYQYPSGLYMGYGFDAAGNINQVSILPPGYTGSTLAQTVEWPAYGPFSGPLGYMSFGNSVNEDLLLDLDYRTAGFQVSTTAGNLTNRTYTYDLASNLTAVNDTVSTANNQTMGYDVINRLTSAVSGAGGYGSYGWTLDKVGNRLTQTYGGSTTNYSYAPGTNRLSAIGSTSVITNANGNITSIPPANSSSSATFSYSSFNRLASETGSPTTASMTYDSFNRRYSKTPYGSKPINYIYNLDGDVIEEENGSTVTDYIYANGRPVGLFVPTGTSGGALYYVQTDRQGIPQYITNTAQGVVWKTSYQPYGATGTITGSLLTQNLRLPGQMFDVETFFNHNGWRDYMPNLGRYLETDPSGLGGGTNTYAYANGNPGKFTDREGLAWYSTMGGKIADELPEQIVEKIAEAGADINLPPDAPPYTAPFLVGGTGAVIGATIDSGGTILFCPSALQATFLAGGALGAGTAIATDAALDSIPSVLNSIFPPQPPLLNPPTNNYGEPGGCGSADCLMYMK